MNNTFQFLFEDLSVLSSEVEEFMGFEAGQSPEPFDKLIEDGLTLAPKHCKILGAYKIFDTISVHPHHKTIQIATQVFSPGKVISARLKKATKVAVFVCTAGAGISELSKQKAAEGDDMMAYILDVIGSVTVDKTAEKIQKKIQAEIEPSGLNITDPFSPGYCNWSVAEQHKLFALLPNNICGISVSDTSLMFPIKSISGISGIGELCKRTGYQCEWCSDKNCIVGKIRRRNSSKKSV
ncbi:Vitamin B12 dependent methionine synthase, activation domain [Mariniphaga anaerophila]|uniref:Vitamin B12 dependent methionine synthase, activation domain n=1 Tax=Mariniphaga anaerophila TaxID=1484053 RepID=A0A1M5A996_9BACT|nr:vitamin B12 dependent-methionine synthase activation domain-containing protein [Mariniphaga anaerophila]SHF26745.1 Vitamin B12 dependent methionine synthase, activation domain [Mariniphaga anaerophila]